MMGEILSIK